MKWGHHYTAGISLAAGVFLAEHRVWLILLLLALGFVLGYTVAKVREVWHWLVASWLWKRKRTITSYNRFPKEY